MPGRKSRWQREFDGRKKTCYIFGLPIARQIRHCCHSSHRSRAGRGGAMVPPTAAAAARIASRSAFRARSSSISSLHARVLSTTASSSSGKQGGADGSERLISPLVYAAGGLAVTVAGGIKYMHDHVGGTEGLARTMSFYSIAIPKYLEYRLHMFKESPDEVWDELDRQTSKQGLEKILELRGFYIKSGQLAAANIGNAFPPIWQDTMSVLQDECPPEPFSVVKHTIETEYGKPLGEVFSSFDETPIGAASIGQVHRAKLLDGTKVVVKVMYESVERIFRGDVRTIKMFAQVAQPVHVPPLEEIEKQFMTEFDYKKEGEQLAKVRENLCKAGLVGDDSKQFAVPKPYLDLSTKKVLVMEELKGEKLANALKSDMAKHAARAGEAVDQFKAEQEEKVRQLRKKGIVKVGPSAKEYDQYVRLLDGERKLGNASKMAYNYSLGWLPGMEWKQYVDRDSLPLINHAKLVDDLIYSHGWEVLVDGYFNGDPHPGNVLLIPRSKGDMQLGLIDYGQVKALSKEDRLLMCKIVIALADENKADVIQLMKEAGYKSQNRNEDIIYLYAKVSYDEDNDELTGGKHIQLFMEDIQAKDPIEALPKDFIMVGRISVMLRGLGHALHQPRSVAKAWKPIAESVLKSEGLL